jgi:hypothetical protein
MEVWIGFLFLAFLSGARVARRGRPERVMWVLAASFVVAGLFLFERFA